MASLFHNSDQLTESLTGPYTVKKKGEREREREREERENCLYKTLKTTEESMSLKLTLQKFYQNRTF